MLTECSGCVCAHSNIKQTKKLSRTGLYRGVPQIHPPPFATLALVQSAGGAYTWDATFSLAITPSLPVPHPQLQVQIEEDNAFDDFAVTIWKDVIYTCGSSM